MRSNFRNQPLHLIGEAESFDEFIASAFLAPISED